MRSAKNTVVCAVILLSALILTAIKGYAAPSETNHWNSNTFGNLNTLTDKTTVTFSITYNESGTIEWFKDGVLADTLSGATSAQFTTSWSETGMKDVKVRMTNGGGTSAETVWPVEVQNIGDATVAEHTIYPQRRVCGYFTIHVSSGWVNIPTLYLKTKKPADWLEYVEKGTYIMKANIFIGQNATLRADDGSTQVLRMRSIPLRSSEQGQIHVVYGATCNIDSMTIVGWDVDNSTEVTNDVESPIIMATADSTLKITNSEFRHIYVNCGETTGRYQVSDVRHVCTVDHNKFLEGNPYLLLMNTPDAIVTDNEFYAASHNLAWVVGEHSLIENNKFTGRESTTWGSNFILGQHCRLIGNEFSYAGWNQVEVADNSFCRDNVMHDNGGIHNGFNTMRHNVYSYNDYAYDFTRFSGFYSQFYDDSKTYPAPRERYPDHVYIINGRAKNVPVGFNFFGGYDIYVYNFVCSSSCGNLQYGSDRFFVRKSSFTDTKISSDFGFRVVDWGVDSYGYVGTVTILDSAFGGVNGEDLGFYPAGNAVLNSINCFRKDSLEKLTLPTNYFYNGYVREWASPEMRFYAWLDVLVKDQSGHLIKDANVTVECLTDPAALPLKVTLPPPPPDLTDLPEENLPQPVLNSFARLKTLSTGKLPGPNYGWSADPEPCVALLQKKKSVDRSSGSVTIKTTTGYQYRITAKYHGLEANQTVTPDETWLREDPSMPAVTVELVLSGDATAGTDTTPPTLTITSPQDNKPVSGTVQIAATASDNWDIDRLEIFVDNISRAVISADSCTWTAESYLCSWTWDTAQERDGLHTIRVAARDVSGNTTEKTITVEVLTQAVNAGSEAVVYPNPYIKGKSRGSTCTFANLEPDAEVRVYTINGDPVTTLSAEMTGDRANAEWDVSKVGGGIYLYTINSSKGVQKGKIGIVK